MDKTNGLTTPGGNPEFLVNPPSVLEAGPTDSGEGQLSHVHQSQISSRHEQENSKLIHRLSEMEKVISQMNDQLQRLTKENELLRNKVINQEQRSDTKIPFEYQTDEEELARETDWIIKKQRRNRKKRKAESSPEVTIESSSFSNEGEVVNESNVNKVHNMSHQGIADLAEKGESKKALPPPVHIIGVKTYEEIKTLVEPVTSSYEIVAQNNNKWKIITTDSDSYRKLAKTLDDVKAQWYTYEDKNTRPIKVMARGLHHTCEKQDIIDDLQQKNYKIIDVVNIMKKERIRDEDGNEELSRRRLPLFMLTFNQMETMDRIHDIRSILNMKVKIEPLRKTSDMIPQCKRCQGFNHTRKFCHRDPRCVKCAEKHLTIDCKLSRNSKPTCINCQEQHPASYRGCEVAKQLQKIWNQRHKQNNQKASARGTVVPDKATQRKPTATSFPWRGPHTSARNGKEEKQTSCTRAETIYQAKPLARSANYENHWDNAISDNLKKAIESQKESLDKIMEKLEELTQKIVHVEARVQRIETRKVRI